MEQVSFLQMKTGMHTGCCLMFSHSFSTGDLDICRIANWFGGASWQYLGRHRHMVLPSSAVSKIRTEFPSYEYTGYQDAPATP